MGLLDVVKTRVTEALDGPVVTMAKGVYEEFAAKPVGEPVPWLYRAAPRAKLHTACRTERALLGDRSMYHQLERDEVKITPAEFARQVIVALRDLKTVALEDDGCVSPAHRITVFTNAMQFTTRARTCFNTMKDISNKGVRLDAVEWRLLEEAMKSHGSTYKSWMRAAQGIVHVVADLRLQHLVEEF